MSETRRLEQETSFFDQAHQTPLTLDKNRLLWVKDEKRHLAHEKIQEHKRKWIRSGGERLPVTGETCTKGRFIIVLSSETQDSEVDTQRRGC